MLIKHFCKGQAYQIELPEGAKIKRTSHGIMIEVNGHLLFDRPGELLVQVARAGDYGLRIVSEPSGVAEGR